MPTLVTGVTSGLGRFLLRTLAGAVGWARGDPLPHNHFDRVVHCAHDLREGWNNVLLLQRLFAVPCDRFVYVSSVEVHKAYGLNGGGYPQEKAACEQFVRQHFGDHLIVRTSAMIGRDARENTVLRMLKGKRLTVTPDSTFGVVRHASLLPVIGSATVGTVTISGTVMPIKDIAEEFGLRPEYGEFPYRTPEVRPTHDTIAEIKEHVLHDPAPDQGTPA